MRPEPLRPEPLRPEPVRSSAATETAPPPDILRLEDIAFRYHLRARWVLRDLTVEFPAGRITEVTGGNGAGKSTLLGIAAGILRPGRGRVTGRPERVGYAPERFPSAQPFTVAGYLRRLADMRRTGPGRAGIGDWADRLGLTPMMDSRLSDLSKGSAQKVGLVQALIGDPELLVLDEPFAGLDRRTRTALPSVLAELADRGGTVLVSDHQRCLKDLPGVVRLHVDDGRVAPVDGRQRPNEEITEAEITASAPREVLEVLVARDMADALAARLRAEGHQVRRSGR